MKYGNELIIIHNLIPKDIRILKIYNFLNYNQVI